LQKKEAMRECDVKRFAMISKINAEIEGMKVENTKVKYCGLGIAFNSQKFEDNASELDRLSYCHNDQL